MINPSLQSEISQAVLRLQFSFRSFQKTTMSNFLINVKVKISQEVT